EAEHALRYRKGQLSGGSVRIVDEAVEHYLRVRPDGEGRLVEKEELGLTLFGGDDPLLEDDVLTDDEQARLAAGRLAAGLRVHGGRRSHPLGGGERGGEREEG